MKRFPLAVVLILAFSSAARAELTPDQVALVAMAESAESQELARYYAKARAVPEGNLLLLPGKPVETLRRDAWEEEVRPAIRKWLTQHDPDRKIRCLVTCWDVPLKIGRREADSPQVVERAKYLSDARKGRVARINAILNGLNQIGQIDAPPKLQPLPDDVTLADMAGRLDSQTNAARDRLMAIAAEGERNQAAQQFESLVVATGGVAQILRMAAATAKAGGEIKPDQAASLAVFNGRLQGLQAGLQALSALPESIPRDGQFMHLLQTASGAIGVIQWIDQEQEAMKKNETYSSFDSELSVVLWQDYPVAKWQPNLLFHGFGGASGNRSVLMVSRLAAPTMELAKGLVDKAVAVEKTGLTGKVYLDARGMSYDPEKSKPGSYDHFDQSLRDLAKRLKEHTKLDVVLDDKAELFQPGACPDAALYCGWYSLAKYVDAFEWRPGAVGYHLASSEATTLRTPGNPVWCNAMLEDGVTATVGPVYEPYLVSFPKPDDFFPLLLTGKLTLVEVYYRTKPFNSWVMVLVGDPLYNPFRAKPALAEGDLPEALRTKP
ncbi:MAG: TIGR03790 family protein [Pirellulales bacterium]|nr:TIGR03790 family protein [Pirellulales bacterium]